MDESHRRVITGAACALVGLVLCCAYGYASSEKAAPAPIVLKGEVSRIELRFEGLNLKARLTADRRTEGVLLVTFIRQDPFCYDQRFTVSESLGLELELPLEFEGKNASLYRLELFEKVPGTHHMRQCSTILIERPPDENERPSARAK